MLAIPRKRGLSLPASQTSFRDWLLEKVASDLRALVAPESEADQSSDWPARYVNRATGHAYAPHSDAERLFLEDTPRYTLCRGGEGSGKSTAGAYKCLERLRRGCNGLVVSPDLQHFRKSLWPEFRRWCPWEMVIPRQRYRQQPEWEPSAPFTLTFVNGAQMLCGGIEDPSGWEGPNVNFAWMDEARRLKSALALKTLDGRVRIPGPHGEPPQIFITTTPRKNWLFEFFGPLKEGEGEEDPHADFKRDSREIILRTIDNEPNLEAGFVAKRSQSLTMAEIRVLLDAEWEDIEAGQRYLEQMQWWYDCQEVLPPLTPRDQLVLALDAGISSDNFACVGVTRHPARPQDVAIRMVQVWEPKGGKLDFGPIEQWLRDFIKGKNGLPGHNVKCVVYDPWQLHDMCTRLNRERIAWFEEFPQTKQRSVADKQLLDLIMNRRLAHSGDAILTRHIDNADRKVDVGDDRSLRIIKREQGLKVDLAVAASMGTYQSLALRLSA